MRAALCKCILVTYFVSILLHLNGRSHCYLCWLSIAVVVAVIVVADAVVVACVFVFVVVAVAFVVVICISTLVVAAIY